jgi:deazaflavin-dependent oxidoreductase (nitroreductase family)
VTFAGDSELTRLASDAKDAFVKFWSTMHEAAFEATDGRILNRVLGMPVVRLVTTGRRSGVPRATMLTAPIVGTDRIVIVASNGGDKRHPQWFHNLVANPDVMVTAAGQTRPMRARVAESAERDQLWDEVLRAGPVYDLYQRATPREIPLVILAPTSAEGGN